MVFGKFLTLFATFQAAQRMFLQMILCEFL